MSELFELIKLALGTPETVNFNALHKLLTRIIQHLTFLLKVSPSESIPSNASARDRRSSLQTYLLTDKGSKPPFKKLRESDDKDATSKTRTSIKVKKKENEQVSSTKRKSSSLKNGASKSLDEEEDETGDDRTGKSAAKTKKNSEREDERQKSKQTDKEERKWKSEEKRISFDKVELQSSLAGRRIEKKASTGSDKDEQNVNMTEVHLGRKDSDKKEKRASCSKQESDEATEEEVKQPRRSSTRQDSKESGTSTSHKNALKEHSRTESLREEAVQGYVEEFADDYTDDEGESYHGANLVASPHRDSVQKQDFADIVKRIEILELDVGIIKHTQTTKQKYDTSSCISPESRNDSDFVESIQQLRKIIETGEKNLQDEMNKIKKSVNTMQEQLNVLPNPAELYKCYFPSWKMLEEALNNPEQLKNAFQELREPRDAGKRISVTQQISMMLGDSGGPSDALITIFKNLTSLLTFPLSSYEVSGNRKQSTSKSVSGQSTSKSSKKSAPDSTSSQEEFMMEDELNQARIAAQKKEPVPLMSTITVTTTPSTTGGESGYLAFRISKLGDDIIGIRKELDEFQLLIDKVKLCEEDIKDLGDVIIDTRRDLKLQQNQEHDVLTALQMELSELHQELNSRKNAVNIEARKDEMARLQMQIAPDPDPLDSIIIDREARIRTQQLQMQVNCIHHILCELQQQLPDFQFSLPPSGVPEDMEHPWRTGRSGAGSNMKNGGGTHATTVTSTLSVDGHGIKMGSKGQTSPIPRSRSPFETRLPPVGGREDETTQRQTMTSSESSKAGKSGPVLDSAAQAMLADLNRKDNEEKVHIQQSLTRLSTAQNMMGAKLEACCNQQASDFRRLQDLMTKMHKEYMTRVSELKLQVEELMADDLILGDNPEASTSLKPAEEEESKAENKERPASAQDAKRVCLRERSTSMSAGRRRSANTMYEIRKELLQKIKNLAIRMKRLELNTVMFDEQEIEAACLKKPVAGFQCLSCDKRLEIRNRYGDLQTPLPPALPDLPRIAPLSSPPRLRNCTSSFGRVRSENVYEIPRQCGGSYTASIKPRRIHYYTSLGDAMENSVEPLAVEKVDVRGTDGHIYRGQLKKHTFNLSNNFDIDEPVTETNRFLNITDTKSP